MADEFLLAEYILPSGSSRYSGIMPSLDDLLTKAGLMPQELGGLTVALGPGSFTGIRIGLSIIKGLSESLDIPVVGVPTLEAMANQLSCLDKDICPLVASRKGEVFTALFRWSKRGELLRVKNDTCVKITEITTIIEAKTVFIGNNLAQQGPVLKRVLGANTLLAASNLWTLRASSVGIVGLRRLRKGDCDNSSELAPLYLRGADIRPPKNKFQ
jgi:tRNA threonylcarbamoyladenosine biosynthesis protein TsaB